MTLSEEHAAAKPGRKADVLGLLTPPDFAPLNLAAGGGRVPAPLPPGCKSGLDVKVCNCAGCGELCLGRCHAEWHFKLPAEQRGKLPRPAAASHRGRPHCVACVRRLYHTSRAK